MSCYPDVRLQFQSQTRLVTPEGDVMSLRPYTSRMSGMAVPNGTITFYGDEIRPLILRYHLEGEAVRIDHPLVTLDMFAPYLRVTITARLLVLHALLSAHTNALRNA